MNYDGELILSDPGSDKPVLTVGTLSCCHCGLHFVVQPGSGRTRGFCMNCNGPVCGPACAACVPTEQFLDNLEKGRPVDYRPIIVPTG